MKNIKNKYIEAKESAPSRGGFSDIRIRFLILLSTTLILLLAPSFGIIGSSVAVLTFAIFIIIKIAEFEQSNIIYLYRHKKAMDEIYYCGTKADYYDGLIKSCEAEARRVENNNSKEVQQKVSLKLALNR